MMFKVVRIALLAAVAIPSAVEAQIQAPAPASTEVAPIEAAPLEAAASPFGGEAVADDTLQAIAGREDTNQIAQSQQAATVTRNSVGDNVRTGDAKIEGQAFQNLSGLAILNVNTGNNVAINAAMNVTVAIAHP